MQKTTFHLTTNALAGQIRRILSCPFVKIHKPYIVVFYVLKRFKIALNVIILNSHILSFNRPQWRRILANRTGNYYN